MQLKVVVVIGTQAAPHKNNKRMELKSQQTTAPPNTENNKKNDQRKLSRLPTVGRLLCDFCHHFG